MTRYQIAVLDDYPSVSAKQLCLRSNRRSAAAIDLYEKLGFVHENVWRSLQARRRRDATGGNLTVDGGTIT